MTPVNADCEKRTTSQNASWDLMNVPKNVPNIFLHLFFFSEEQMISPEAIVFQIPNKTGVCIGC